MQQIKGKDTKPELLLRSYLHANGFCYSLHKKTLPGKPDLVLTNYHTVIFVHGCFWHGHTNCRYFTVPKTRTKWWTDKISHNKANDAKAARLLKKENWTVLVVWACSLKPKKREKTLENVVKKIQGIT